MANGEQVATSIKRTKSWSSLEKRIKSCPVIGNTKIKLNRSRRRSYSDTIRYYSTSKQNDDISPPATETESSLFTTVPKFVHGWISAATQDLRLMVWNRLERRSTFPLTAAKQCRKMDPTSLWCAFCGKNTTHSTDQHVCSRCRSTGDHRGSQCPNWGQSMKKIVQSLPFVSGFSLFKAGSQTPVTTPLFTSYNDSSGLETPAAATGYVLSYAEGHSVVPESILNVMRLIMHHPVSTNAFRVVVQCVSTWDDQLGTLTPISCPATPNSREQYRYETDQYTRSMLNGARMKLEQLIIRNRGNAPSS